MDEYQSTSALEAALEKVVGEHVAEAVATARDATSFTITEAQTWVLFVAVLIVAIGGLIKNMRGGPVQIIAETWRDEQAFRREWRREKERRKGKLEEDECDDRSSN